MSEHETENPIMAPVFRRIYDNLRRRKALQSELLTKAVIDEDAAEESAVSELIQQIGEVEIEVFRALVELADTADSALKASGKSTRVVDLARRFKAFQYSQATVAGGTYKYHVTISKTDEERSPGPMEDVVFVDLHDGRLRYRLGVALDLLQYWELWLRHQTEIECDDFCSGTRESLYTRIGNSLQRDLLIATCPPAQPENAPVKTPTIAAVESDIFNRLDRIVRRLRQLEAEDTKIRGLPGEQFRKSQQERKLRTDEVSVVLSELVHLLDNTAKWLRTRNRSDELAVVEDLLPYRVAACYVNTEKHGVRGRNKESAVAEYEVLMKDSDDKTVHGVDLIINFKGKAWQASLLIDDLLQIWELFLRYHTDLDTTAFRSELGKRFAARKPLATYTAEFGDQFEADLVKRARERKHYTI